MAGTLVLYATRDGARLWIDSASYIAAARNLAAGRGLILPTGDAFGVSAPLFSLLLAVADTIGPDSLVAARWMNAGFCAATIFLSAMVLSLFCNGHRLIPMVGAVLIGSSSDFLQVHQFALSEGLFLFLMVSSLGLLAVYHDTNDLRMLSFAATAAALSFLTRYAGVTLVAVGAVTAITMSNRSLMRRVAAAALWVAISLGPSLVWGWLVRSPDPEENSREIGMHLLSMYKIRGGIKSLVSWVMPLHRISLLVLGLVCVVVAVVVIARVPRHAFRRLIEPQTFAPRLAALPWILFVFSALYAAMLVLTITFVDYGTVLTTRILLPMHLSVLLLALSLAAVVAQATSSRTVRAIGLFAATWVFGLSLYRMPATLEGRSPEGLKIDYTHSRWRNSSLIAAVRELPPDARIYTSANDVLYLLTGRSSLRMPNKWNARKERANDKYSAHAENLKSTIATAPAVFVFVDDMRRTGWMTEQEAVSLYGLRPISEHADGRIYSTD